jgi:Pyridoxamine 5'-phosphate oxidase
MGKFHNSILPAHQKFIEEQYMFFVATAPLASDGHINLSPKGGDTFRVLSETAVAYLDFFGSGNETSAHLLENERITIMFCAYKGAPNILRLYGKGRVILPSTPDWERYNALFPSFPQERQIIVTDVHLVQTSCGFSVPLYDYVGERTIMEEWVAKKGKEGVAAYIQEKNLSSLDKLPTHYGQVK